MLENPDMELSPILRLPHEILHQIFSSASHTTPYPLSGRIWDHKLPSTVLSICLTCSHFNRISRRFIFESIFIRNYLPARNLVLSAVHARFRDEPELRASCQRLQLNLDYLSREHYEMVGDLLRWLKNVRYLSIWGFFAPEKEQDGGSSSSILDGGSDDSELKSHQSLWGLIRLVNHHMKNLELLRFMNQWGRICHGDDLILNIDIPSLKELQVMGLVRSTGSAVPNKVY